TAEGIPVIQEASERREATFARRVRSHAHGAVVLGSRFVGNSLDPVRYVVLAVPGIEGAPQLLFQPGKRLRNVVQCRAGLALSFVIQSVYVRKPAVHWIARLDAAPNGRRSPTPEPS